MAAFNRVIGHRRGAGDRSATCSAQRAWFELLMGKKALNDATHLAQDSYPYADPNLF